MSKEVKIDIKDLSMRDILDYSESLNRLIRYYEVFLTDTNMSPTVIENREKYNSLTKINNKLYAEMERRAFLLC
jgi:hypothetical protein